jgi:hypothetical protein
MADKYAAIAFPAPAISASTLRIPTGGLPGAGDTAPAIRPSGLGAIELKPSSVEVVARPLPCADRRTIGPACPGKRRCEPKHSPPQDVGSTSLSSQFDGFGPSRLAEVYEVYLQTAEELVALPAALDAELWTCAQLGGLNTAAPHSDGYRYALADLIGVMEGAESRAALAFLRVVAAVGPTAVRSDADQGAIRLSQKG